jgi:hypothetical protein
MKYLRIFEGFQSESEVAIFCKEYGIENWSINSEGLVDGIIVNSLGSKKLTKFPLKFGTFTGNFDCDGIELTSLIGCPHTVGGYFHCSNNKLTSLEGCPNKVGGDFRCNHNQITSFEGGPKSIGGNFYCYNNPLFSIWKLISPNYKWNDQVMELFNDYDCIRGTDIIIDRFNDFLEEIGKDPVEKVEGYNNI